MTISDTILRIEFMRVYKAWLAVAVIMLAVLIGGCGAGGGTGSSALSYGSVSFKLREDGSLYRCIQRSKFKEQRFALLAETVDDEGETVDDEGETDTPFLNRIEADFFEYSDDESGSLLLSFEQDVTRDQEEVVFSDVPAPQDYLIQLRIYFSDSVDKPIYTPRFRAYAQPGATVVAQQIAPKLAAISVSATQDTIRVGDTLHVSALGIQDDGTTAELQDVSWSISSDSLASITADSENPSQAVLCGLAAGSVEAIAESEGFRDSVTITVTAADAVELSLNPSSLGLYPGETKTLQAVVLFSDGSSVEWNEDLEWNSSDDGVATVSDGLVTGIAEGTATIKATYGDIFAKAVVTVWPNELVSFELSPESSKLYVGASVTLSAQGTMSDGSTVDLEPSELTWISSDTSKASVSGGVVIAVAAGSASITAEYEGLTSENAVAVNVERNFGFRLSHAYSLGVADASELNGYSLSGYWRYDQNGVEHTGELSAVCDPGTLDASNKTIDYVLVSDFAPDSDNIRVFSIVLNAEKDGSSCAFEWWDSADGVTVSNDADIKVNDNEFAGGEGMDASPYLIANPRHLDNVRNHLHACFRQTADLDLGSACGMSGTVYDEGTAEFTTFFKPARCYNGGEGWQPIGTADDSFTGTYDGAGKKICGLAMYYGPSVLPRYCGLFACASDAVLKNIEIDDNSCIAISNTEGRAEQEFVADVGTLLAYADGVTVENCISRCDISAIQKGTELGSSFSETSSGFGIGGIVGKILRKGTIKDSTNYGNLYGYAESNYGGVHAGGIINCLGTSSALDDSDASSIENCVNYGNASATSLGVRFANIDSFPAALSGGIVAWHNYSPVSCESCFNYGEISAVANYMAVASGIIRTKLSGSYNTSTPRIVRNCANYGKIDAYLNDDNGSYADDYRCFAGAAGIDGGIGSFASAYVFEFTNCFNCGRVAAHKANSSQSIYAGGICGRNATSDIKYCYNTGHISADSDSSIGYANVGGICAFTYQTYTGCAYSYNAGTVEATIAGTVSTTRVGALVGYRYAGTVRDGNYYLEGIASRGVGSGGGTTTAISDDKFKNESPVTGSQYLWQALGGTEQHWMINTFDDGELGANIMQRYPVFDWQSPPQP